MILSKKSDSREEPSFQASQTSSSFKSYLNLHSIERVHDATLGTRVLSATRSWIGEYRNSRGPFGKDYRTKGVGHVIRDKAVNTPAVSASLRRKFIPGVKRVAGSTRRFALSWKRRREKEKEERREIEKRQARSLKRADRCAAFLFLSLWAGEALGNFDTMLDSREKRLGEERVDEAGKRGTR